MQVKIEDFFASANSGRGFINMFEDIFCDLEHLYIIKGGSGTGKSSLMKKAASAAQAKGYSVEFCRCSSDPDSIDGIIIHGLDIGIIDGTAPHSADTKCPGAYDEFINTGDFWNGEMLKEHRNEIAELNRCKIDMFGRVYTYLGAALALQGSADQLCAPHINRKKLEAAVERTFKKLALSQKGKQSVRLTEGITMNGYIRLKSFDTSENKYYVNNSFGIGHIYLAELEKRLCKNNIKHTVSYLPLDTKKLNMIYINETDSLFTVNSIADYTKSINTERFINKNGFLQNDYKRAVKYSNTLLNEALNILPEIKKQHFKLEDIYVKAMDFEKLNRYEDELFSKIIK